MALYAGITEVEKWRARISAEQMKAWQEYAELEPFGPVQEDYRAGILWTATVSQYAKNPPDMTELFPSLKPDEVEEDCQSPEDMVSALQAWTVLSGGKVIDPSCPT